MLVVNRFKLAKMVIVVIIIIAVLLVIGFTVFGYMHLNDESDNLIASYTITFASFVISVIALIIALNTYMSIDAVNSITSMDGNVLQNGNYSVSYFEMLKELSEEKDQNGFMKRVFDNMMCNKKSTMSCIEYTDWLQRIIDNLIWLAYVKADSKEYNKKKQAIIQTIKKELKKYSELSNGIQYILQEHVKLIENVIFYIEWSDHNKDEQKVPLLSRMEDIRGKMIQNPISQIVYYDYLGLNYHKKVKTLLAGLLEQDISNMKDREVSFYRSIMSAINANKSTSSDLVSKTEIPHVVLLLNKSFEAFNEALSVAKSDLLWEGYIQYNLIRIKLLKSVVMGNFLQQAAELNKDMDDVIEIRKNIQYLYSREDSFIFEEFGGEINRAEELKKVVEELARVTIN